MFPTDSASKSWEIVMFEVGIGNDFRLIHLDLPPPSNLITMLIMKGHARFLPSDQDGLFVKWALQACHWRNTEWDLEYVIDFLCPLEIMPNITQIAGGLLAPAEKASGQLRRLV